MKKFCQLSALVLLSISTADAAEKYVLAKKNHQPPAGTKVEQTKQTSLSDGIIELKMQGQEMKGTCVLNESENESLSFAGDKITHLLNTSVKKRVMTLNGQEMPEEAPTDALLKVPVVLTKADGKWTAKLEGDAEPTEEQKAALEKLAKKANKDQDAAMYGTEPREIGDTWNVDAKDLSFTEDDKETTGGMKFTFKGVEEFEGRKCARLEGTLELAGKTDEDKGGQKISLKGDVVVLRSLEDLEDLKVSLKGKMEMAGEIPNGSMTMGGEMKIEQTAKITK